MSGFWLMLLGIVAGNVAAKLGEAWNSDVPFGIMVGAWVWGVPRHNEGEGRWLRTARSNGATTQ